MLEEILQISLCLQTELPRAVDSVVMARSLIFGLGTGRYTITELFAFLTETEQNLYLFLKFQPSFPLAATLNFCPITVSWFWLGES